MPDDLTHQGESFYNEIANVLYFSFIALILKLR